MLKKWEIGWRGALYKTVVVNNLHFWLPWHLSISVAQSARNSSHDQRKILPPPPCKPEDSWLAVMEEQHQIIIFLLCWLTLLVVFCFLSRRKKGLQNPGELQVSHLLQKGPEQKGLSLSPLCLTLSPEEQRDLKGQLIGQSPPGSLLVLVCRVMEAFGHRKGL